VGRGARAREKRSLKIMYMQAPTCEGSAASDAHTLHRCSRVLRALIARIGRSTAWGAKS
jgi:hypothetical protein